MNFNQLKNKDQAPTKRRPMTEEIILNQTDYKYTLYDVNDINTREKTKMIDIS